MEFVNTISDKVTSLSYQAAYLVVQQCERSAGCAQFLVIGKKLCYIIMPTINEQGKFRPASTSVSVQEDQEMWHGRIQRTNSDGKSSECGVVRRSPMQGLILKNFNRF
jgi:hypothetical protein